MIRPSGYSTWSDEQVSRELDRVEKMELKPGTVRAADRSRVVGNLRAEIKWREANPPKFGKAR